MNLSDAGKIDPVTIRVIGKNSLLDSDKRCIKTEKFTAPINIQDGVCLLPINKILGEYKYCLPHKFSFFVNISLDQVEGKTTIFLMKGQKPVNCIVFKMRGKKKQHFSSSDIPEDLEKLCEFDTIKNDEFYSCLEKGEKKCGEGEFSLFAKFEGTNGTDITIDISCSKPKS